MLVSMPLKVEVVQASFFLSEDPSLPIRSRYVRHQQPKSSRRVVHWFLVEEQVHRLS